MLSVPWGVKEEYRLPCHLHCSIRDHGSDSDGVGLVTFLCKIMEQNISEKGGVECFANLYGSSAFSTVW